MGDIWLPGFPPAYTNWGSCKIELQRLGLDRDHAIILAAIAGPESSFDWTVINDTPATGDYSVGLWQINYYGSLYAERRREFGTPRHLVACGLLCQAQAALSIYRSQGFDAWYNTYHSGAWKKYVGSGPIVGAPGPGGQLPVAPKETARDDWSGHIHRSASQFNHVGDAMKRYAIGFRHARYHR